MIRTLFQTNSKSKRLPWIMGLCLSLAACIPHYVSYYDSATYKNLTDLKAEMMLFYDALAKDPAGTSSAQDIRVVQLDVAKTYEYEKGKTKNDETITQIDEIKKMFAGTLELLQKQGKLNPDYIQLKKEQMGAAFDIAIRTESKKLKE